MDNLSIISLFAKDLGFPKSILDKYIRDPQEARDAIVKGGLPILSEVIIKNWASHYFSRDMKVNKSSNQKGFDIVSVDGEISIEVKTTWKPDSKYASFKSINQKRNKDGSYAFSHIAFYSPLLNPKGVVLFSSKKFEEQVVIPPAGKLNIKMNLSEGHTNNSCHSSSQAFYDNMKWMVK